MEEQRFMELLGELIAIGTTNGGFLSRKEVEDCFSELHLSPEQFDMIASYLKQNQITITDYDTMIETKEEAAMEAEDREVALEQEEAAYYDMYLEDLGRIPAFTEGESDRLLMAIKAGDDSGKSRLIEGYLHFVAKLARNHAGQGVTVNDLVQEGNMALIMAVEAFEEGEFESFLFHEVERSLVRLIEEQTGQKQIGEKIAGRANRLMELSAKLAEELGREATVEELADRMHITEEEVKDIMKISLDVITVAEAAGDPSAFEAYEEEHHCDDPHCHDHHRH